MGLTTKIILGLIVFHLLLGFGWILYKLAPGTKTKPGAKEPGGPPDENEEPLGGAP
jgi:hypothetical protein